MAISVGSIETLADKVALNARKSFSDRIAEKLRAKATDRTAIWDHEAAQALNDMADVFQTEGWNP